MDFLTRDERGRLLPEYPLSVSRQLAEEHATMRVELQTLTKNVDPIRSMEGCLTYTSSCQGAPFTIELPLTPEQARA